MIRITKDEFETFKRHKDPEVFTEAAINSWVMAHQETIQKADVDELNDIEKSEVQLFNDEFSSFMKVEVVKVSDDLLTKSLQYDTFYVREQQVEFDKAEDGSIEKSRHGKYLDTAHNRKMGRVGAEFGHAAKKEEEDEDPEGMSESEMGHAARRYDKKKEEAESKVGLAKEADKKPEATKDSEPSETYKNISKKDLDDYGGYIGLALEAAMNSQGDKHKNANIRACFEQSGMSKNKFMTKLKKELYDQQESLGEDNMFGATEDEWVDEAYGEVESALK